MHGVWKRARKKKIKKRKSGRQKENESIGYCHVGIRCKRVRHRLFSPVKTVIMCNGWRRTYLYPTTTHA